MWCGLVWFSLVWFGLVSFGLPGSGLVCYSFGLVWVGLGWAGLVCFGVILFCFLCCFWLVFVWFSPLKASGCGGGISWCNIKTTVSRSPSDVCDMHRFPPSPRPLLSSQALDFDVHTQTGCPILNLARVTRFDEMAPVGPLTLYQYLPPQLAYVEGCQDGKPGPIPLGLGPKQQINTRKTEPLSFVSALV